MADVARLEIVVGARTGSAVRSLTLLDARMRQMQRTMTRTSDASNQLAGSTNRLSGSTNRAGGSFGRAGGQGRRYFTIITAVLFATAALNPVTRVMVGGLASLTTMFAMSGVAAGVFGLAIVGAFKNSEKVKESVKGMKKEFKAFSMATLQFTEQPIITFLKACGESLGKMVPLVGAVAPVVNNIATSFRKWVSVKMDGWVKFISATAVPILWDLVTVAKNVGSTLGIMFKDFAGSSKSMAESMAIVTAKMKGWAEGGGFEDFLKRIKENSPAVKEFFKALIDALKQLNTAFTGLGPAALGLTTALLQLIAVTPVPMLQALIMALIAAKIAMTAHTVAMGISTLATRANGVATRITALAQAFMRSTLITTIGVWALQLAALIANGVQMLVLRARLFGLAAAQVATAAGARVWAAAQWLLNAAVRAFPVIMIITGILALIAAIVWVATKTTWFQTAWKYSWNAIKMVFWMVVNGIVTGAKWFWSSLVGIWNGLRNAVATGWRTTWTFVKAFFWTCVNGVIAAARWFWSGIVGVWNAIKRNVSVIWNALWNWVKSKAIQVWIGIKTAAFGFWRTMVSIWNAISRNVSAIWKGLWKGVTDTAKNVWSKITGAARSFGSTFKGVWESIKNGVAKIWDKLKAAFKKPISFVINTVYNKGLVPLWNSTAAKLPGLGKMKKMPEFATGGYTGNGARMAPKGIVHGGEFVTKKSSTSRIERNHPGLLGHMNRTGSLPGYSSGGMVGGLPGYDGGGFVDTLAGIGGSIKDMVKGGISGIGKGFEWASGMLSQGAAAAFEGVWNSIVGPMKKLIPGGKDNPGVVDGLKKTLDKWRDMIADLIRTKEMSASGFQPFRPWREGDGEHVSYKGHTFNKRTVEMLKHAQKIAKTSFSIAQGSYSSGVGASAGTHSGGGAVDLGPAKDSIVGAMRASGFAAWRRTPSEGFSPHIHGIAVGDPTVSGAAANQVKAMFAGKNGLANNGPDTYNPFGGSGSKRWAGVASAVLRELGIFSSYNLGAVLKTIQKESGGNPRAINNWDSNARRGTPSKGLIQTIDPTFNAYAGKYRSRGPYDPYANIYAGIRYARATYGSGWAARMARPGGYANGTNSAKPGWHMVGERGPELMNFGGGERVMSNEVMGTLLSASRGGGNGGGGDTYVSVTIEGNALSSKRELEELFTKTMTDMKRKNRLP